VRRGRGTPPAGNDQMTRPGLWLGRGASFSMPPHGCVERRKAGGALDTAGRWSDPGLSSAFRALLDIIRSNIAEPQP
jgi:hypothetical protein